MDKKVTVEQFAEMEGKNKDTIYRWIQDGRMDGEKGKPRAEKDPGGYGWKIVLPAGYVPVIPN